AELIYDTETVETAVWDALQEVMDPEIPVLSVIDLGIIPQIEVTENAIKVYLTPTFSGCPAIQFMQKNIVDKLNEKLPGYPVEVKVDFTRQWSSNLITEKGR